MEIGSLVRSISGRDKGRYYMVIAAFDSRILQVVDGSIKTLSKPKNKNIKHLVKISEFNTLKEKIESNKQIFDKEINKAINTYLQSLDKK